MGTRCLFGLCAEEEKSLFFRTLDIGACSIATVMELITVITCILTIFKLFLKSVTPAIKHRLPKPTTEISFLIIQLLCYSDGRICKRQVPLQARGVILCDLCTVLQFIRFIMEAFWGDYGMFSNVRSCICMPKNVTVTYACCFL